jgi:hypothetical protein
VHAAEWPTRAVTVVVPYAAGGFTDTLARFASKHLSEKYGQPFVIENRPGAGGAIAAAYVPPAERNKDRSYFAAWGEFKSPGAIPSAYVKQAPKGLPEGKLVIEYRQEDLGLIVVYRWQETLTDVVTIDDMHRAREELADLVIPLTQNILERALGEEYDATRLVDWLHQTGRPWFFEITDVVVAGAARGEKAQQRTLLALARVCGRHGLVLVDPAGELFDAAETQAAVARFATKVLRDNLRRRDGTAAPEETIEEILQWAGLKERPENSEEQFRKYDEAVKAALAEAYGGQDQLGELLKPLLTRILGLYVSELFGSPREFVYTLAVPGTIVETNGTIVDDARVRWTFSGGDAYPFGYAMECESLAAQGELEGKLLGRRVLKTRERMLDYVELMRAEEPLRRVMAACVAAKSMAPYYQARDEAAAASTEEGALEALGKLLELPSAPR